MQHLTARVGPRGRLLQDRQFGILPGKALAKAMLVQFCPKSMALGGALQFSVRSVKRWWIEAGKLCGRCGARISCRGKARGGVIADQSCGFDQASQSGIAFVHRLSFGNGCEEVPARRRMACANRRAAATGR